MKSKIFNAMGKISSIVVGVFTTLSLKVSHALAEEFSYDTMITYAPPEVFACGDDKLCLFFYKIGRFFDNIKHSWFIVLLLIAFLLVAIILGGNKLISKITHKKEQKGNDNKQKIAKK